MTLPPPFAGRPAGVGAQVGAFSIDVIAVTAVGIVAGLATSSLAFGLLVSAEAVLALWILQARTGASIGTTLLRLRVSTVDAPASPGGGRVFVRGFVVGLGALVFVAGAWVVHYSSQWDRTGARRTWADFAAQTRVIALPRTARRDGGIPALIGPTLRRLRASLPSAVSSRPRRLTRSQPASAAIASTEVAAAVTAGTGENAAGRIDGEAMLAFDTGQRERLTLPATVVLGAAPLARSVGDTAITVRDAGNDVAAEHLRLEWTSAGIWVTDLGSLAGTEVIDPDGSRRALVASERIRVDDDIRVRLGERTFTLGRLAE